MVLVLILKLWNTSSMSAACNILGVTAGLHGVIEAVINDAINTVATH